MDGSNWKRILLHWTNRSGLYERFYYNLEQTDIEEFFQKYIERLSDKEDKNIELITFLKEQYPEFELNLDDDNHLSTSDYMYIYSILLHYCCVKNPEKYFHKICENLQEQFQIVIASFFKELLNKNLTKSNLRHAIAKATPKTVLQFPVNESPARTPRNIKESPPTPKTSLLEENKKELNLLKALLETERYEKGFLEVQIKQYDDKINKLNQEQKDLITKIQELRNELLRQNTENSSPVKNMEDEQIKKRLRKEISEKEETIYALKLNIAQLEEEKDLSREKLLYAQQQVMTCLQNIKDMDKMINDLKVELEMKNEQIVILTETKSELEQFIKEIRSNNSYPNEMNTSAECLDISFNRSSSGSVSSTENLGCSVIDIQLREKENENRVLREHIEKMNLDHSKLVKHIRDLMIKHSNVFEICNENLIANEEGDVTETFIVFENYVEKLAKNYLNLINTSHVLQEEIDNLNLQNKNVNDKVNNLEELLTVSEKRIKEFLKDKVNMTKEQHNLKQTYDECLSNLNDEINQKKTIIESVEKLTNAFDELKNKKHIEKEEFLKEIEIKDKLIEENSLYILNIEKQIKEHNEKLSLIKTQNNDLQKDKLKLNEIIENLKLDMKQTQNVIQELIDSNKDLQNCIRTMENSSKHMAEEIEKMVKDDDIKENTIKLLASELSTSDDRNTILNKKIEYLQKNENSLVHELQQNNSKIELLEQSIKILNNKKGKTEKEFDKYRQSKKEIILKMERENTEFRNEIEKYREMNDNAKCNMEKSIEKIQLLERTIEDLKKDNDTLTNKMCNKDKEYENLKSQIEIIKTDKNTIIEELQKNKNELIQKIELLEENNKIFDREIGLLVMKMENGNDGDNKSFDDISNAALKKLKDNLNYLLNENATLKKEVNNLQENVKNLSEEMNKLRSLNNVIIEKDQKLNKLDEEFKLKNQSFEKEKNNLNEKISELQITIRNLEKNYTNLKGINLELENRSIQLNNELQQKNKDNAEFSSNINSLQCEINRLSNELKESVKKLETKTEQLNEIKKQKDEIIKKLNEKIIIYEKSEQNNEIISKSHIEKIQILQNEQKELFQKIDEQTESLNEKTNRIHDLENIEKSLREEIEKLKKELNDLNTEKIQIQDKLQTCKITVTEAHEKLQEYENEHIKELNMYKQKLEEAELKSKESIKKLEKEKCSVLEELKETKDKVDALESNISSFIEQTASLKTEQEELNKQNNSLKSELSPVTEKYKKSQKTIIENEEEISKFKSHVQELENAISVLEKDITEKQKNYEELQVEFDSFKNENYQQKLKSDDIINNLNERLEKVSIQLDQSQAQIKTTEKENETITENTEKIQKIIENLKKDNLKINNDYENLKQKYTELQLLNDELRMKNQNIKSENNIAQEEFTKYQIVNTELNEKIEIIENDNQELQNKFNKLSNDYEKIFDELNNIKTENEILNQTNSTLISDITKLTEILNVDRNNLIVKCEKISDYEMDNENLKSIIENLRIQLNNAHDNNEKYIDNISKLTLRIEILSNENEILKNEIITLKTDINDLQSKQHNLETDNINSLANLKELQLREIEIIDENSQSQKELKEQIFDLENLLNEKDKKIQKYEENNSDKYHEIEIKTKLINELTIKLNEFENNYKHEKIFNEKLQNDVEILRAKLIKNRQVLEEKEHEWSNEKKTLIETVETAENRIKDNRLELEGKLEKMKTKMKTLYNDEVAKIKTKHDREIEKLKHDIEVLKSQNQKYENHTQFLTKQLYQLNEKNANLQKHNKLMETRLKDYESFTPLSKNLDKRNFLASTQGLNSNLQMEDEEGELFNNTYLTDLKTGRISPTFGRDSISVDELKYRNSLAPPHLRSTYLAQYAEHDLPEDDIKDGVPNNFDDSLSSLLQTGQRKKLSGTTLYKKPGPPTPSKNAGRLSLGGNGGGGGSSGFNDNPSHPREILKEFHDIGNVKKTTPNKFRLFSGTKSSKDESLSEPVRILRERKKSITIKNGAFTSTPRKSKAHYDQRRQLDLFLNCTYRNSTDSESTRPDDIEHDSDEVFDMKIPVGKEFKKLTPELFTKWRQTNIQSTTTTESCTTSESNSPCVKDEEKPNRFKDRRISVYSRGSIISGSKLHSNVIRNQMRNRAKYQRCITFNRYRKSLTEISLRKSLLNRKKSTSSPPLTNELKLLKQQQKQHKSIENVCDNKEIILHSIDTTNKTDLNSDYLKNCRFEELIKNKESSAPFEVADLNLMSTVSSNITDGLKSNCTTTINTTNASSKNTVYAGSIIINRKIPHVNVQIARKISLYFGSTNGRGVILLAGQTISIMDLIVLWNRMSFLTKFVLIILFFAFILHIYFLL